MKSNENSAQQWYAAYTRPHHERTAAEQMERRSMEHLLPTFPSVRKWKDRRKVLDLPLFPGYVFVRIALERRLNVLMVPGVVRLVGFGDCPVAMPDHEIDALRIIADHRFEAEPCSYFAVGQRVRITCGPLKGTEGMLRRRKGKLRLLLSIDLIQRSVMVEVGSTDVEVVPVARRASILQIA
jgi:transcription antitermination factor NusG